MTDTINIVLHGRDAVRVPGGGKWAPFTMRPGVATFHRAQWDAACSALPTAGFESFYAALSSHLIGPLDDTPQPIEVTRKVLVSPLSEEGKAALAAEETHVTIDIPDEPEPEPKKKKTSKKAKKG